MKKFVLSIVVLTLALTFALATLSAGDVMAGPNDIHGLTPEYDSGWVDCAGYGAVQTFTHNLGGYPLVMTVMAMDEGVAQAQSTFYYHPNTNFYGYLDYGNPTDYALKIKWRKYIANSNGSWIDADGEYTRVRVLIWAWGEFQIRP